MFVHEIVGVKFHKYVKNGVEKEAVFVFTHYDDPAVNGQACESHFMTPAQWNDSGAQVGDSVKIFKNRGFVVGMAIDKYGKNHTV